MSQTSSSSSHQAGQSAEGKGERKKKLFFCQLSLNSSSSNAFIYCEPSQQGQEEESSLFAVVGRGSRKEKMSENREEILANFQVSARQTRKCTPTMTVEVGEVHPFGR